MPNEGDIIETLRDLLDSYFQHHNMLRLDSYNKNQLEKLEAFAQQHNFDVHIRNNKDVIYSMLWDMVMERIIEPIFREDLALKIAGFRPTKYGKKLLQGLPIDRPNKYLDYLTSQVPNIDSQVVVYVQESLGSYNLGCYFASSVMLGVASERLFELLIDAYTNAIQNPDAQEKFRKRTVGRGISQQYDEFKKKLPDLIGKNGITDKDGPSTRRLRYEFKHAIEITFDSIRSHRDYAAHPRDGIVPRHIIKGHLEAFPLFCQRVYEAIEWLNKNKIC